jgi:hypothetical protein
MKTSMLIQMLLVLYAIFNVRDRRLIIHVTSNFYQNAARKLVD